MYDVSKKSLPFVSPPLAHVNAMYPCALHCTVSTIHTKIDHIRHSSKNTIYIPINIPIASYFICRLFQWQTIGEFFWKMSLSRLGYLRVLCKTCMYVSLGTYYIQFSFVFVVKRCVYKAAAYIERYVSASLETKTFFWGMIIIISLMMMIEKKHWEQNHSGREKKLGMIIIWWRRCTVFYWCWWASFFSFFSWFF